MRAPRCRCARRHHSTFNLCFTTHQQDDSQLLENPRTFEWEESGAQERHTFDQQMHGLLPGAMRSLREQRQDVRAKQKTLASETLEYKVLDARQLSIKVVMNSCYGALGAGEKSMLANVPIAKTITYLGRCIITECARYTTETYGFRVLYIDTDSTYVEIRNEELASNRDALMQFAFDLGKTLELEVSQHIRTHFAMVDADAFVLECEDVIRGLLIPSKKRYAARLYKTPTLRGKLLVKGLSIKRRDTCVVFQNLLSDILERAIDVTKRSDAKQIIITAMDSVFGQFKRGEVPIEMMATSKALRSSYAGTPPVHWCVAEKRRARGEVVRAGERVPFIFVVVPNERAVKTQGDRAEDPAYVKLKGLQVDYAFYVTSQLRGPVEQLLEPFWVGAPNYLLEWTQRLRGQPSIRSFFAPKAAPARRTAGVAVDDDAAETVAAIPVADDDERPMVKRGRFAAYDGIPCGIVDDDDE